MGVPAEKEGGSLNEVQIDGHSAIHSDQRKMKLGEIQADIPHHLIRRVCGRAECINILHLTSSNIFMPEFKYFLDVADKEIL